MKKKSTHPLNETPSELGHGELKSLGNLLLEIKNFDRSSLRNSISDSKKNDEVKKLGQQQDIMSELKAKIEKRRAMFNGNPPSIISHSSSSSHSSTCDIKLPTHLTALDMMSELKAKVEKRRIQMQIVTIFKEIVRRMVNSETSREMISFQEKNLIDAVIDYENMINNGKNSQGELIHFRLNTKFSSINEELMKLIMQIINFHCSTLQKITIDRNYIYSSNLKIFYSSLKLNSALFLREINIWQDSSISECIPIILEQLQSNISLKVITGFPSRFQINEIPGWKSVENELNYNIELEFATKVLPILILYIPKDIVHSVIVDFLIGDLNIPQRKNKPLYFEGEDEKFIKHMGLAKPGLTTLSMPKVIPIYYQPYILTFVTLHRATLQSISFPTLSSAILFGLSLFTPTNFFLTELDISEDKSQNIKELGQILAYLKNNSTLKKLTLTSQLNFSLEEKCIKEQIKSELTYNEQLDVAHVTLTFFLKMYNDFNQESDDTRLSKTAGEQILMIIMSFLLGDELYPQRLNKGVSYDLSGLTVFGNKFRQSESLETETATRLHY